MSLMGDRQANRIAACLQAICAAKYVRDDNVPCQIEPVTSSINEKLSISHPNFPFKLNFFEYILQGLFMGSVGVALNRDALKSSNITHVLVVAKSLDPAFPSDFIYKKIEGN